MVHAFPPSSWCKFMCPAACTLYCRKYRHISAITTAVMGYVRSRQAFQGIHEPTRSHDCTNYCVLRLGMSRYNIIVKVIMCTRDRISDVGLPDCWKNMQEHHGIERRTRSPSNTSSRLPCAVFFSRPHAKRTPECRLQFSFGALDACDKRYPQLPPDYTL